MSIGSIHPHHTHTPRYVSPPPPLLFLPQILTIACGGIDTLEQAGKLTDEGYDAVVLGRSLVAAGGGGRGAGGASGPELIRGIVERVGVPRNMIGWGVSAEDLDYDDGQSR